MGKQGPCYHCGVTSTPLWRNGPPEKPILCNACGSRWRTKGSLKNYIPLHARFDPDDYEDHRMARVKAISLKKKDEKLNKRKLNYENTVDDGFNDDYGLSFLKNIDDNTSNRSSSGSAISNSESCAQFSSADASDFTGPAHSIMWDALVPSKRRTCVIRQKQSSVEKLTKDLCTILHEQTSHFFGSSEEDLLFESEAPMVSVEIGHGSVLIRHPSSMGRESESESTSLSIDNKHCEADEGYSTLCESKIVIGKEKFKPNSEMMHVEQDKRDKGKHEKSHTSWTRNSPLCNVDLTEIVSLDTFWTHLTAAEQQELFKYLPPIDTSVLPESLISMFSSPLFKENLSSFQQLLSEGVLDTSFPGVETEDCEILKKLTLSDFMKCKWVEHYTLLKDKRTEQSTRECSSISQPKSSFSSNLVNAKKSNDNHSRPETKFTMKAPKRQPVKGGDETEASVQIERSCLAPRNLFSMQSKGGSFMFNSFQFEDESSDKDLLLDIPSNGLFPEAELLHPSSSCSSIHPPHIYP